MVDDVYTTGKIAKICKVAPRTVSKWIDSGKLKGYRIPGSNDRRVPQKILIEFLQSAGMPLPPELERVVTRRVVLVGVTGQDRERIAAALTSVGLVSEDVATVFDAGLALRAEPRPYALILDSSLGHTIVEQTAARIRDVPDLETMLLIALVSEDQADARVPGCNLTLAAPYDLSLVQQVIGDFIKTAA